MALQNVYQHLSGCIFGGLGLIPIPFHFLSPMATTPSRLDIWAVGCTACHMADGKYPWHRSTIRRIQCLLAFAWLFLWCSSTSFRRISSTERWLRNDFRPSSNQTEPRREGCPMLNFRSIRSLCSLRAYRGWCPASRPHLFKPLRRLIGTLGQFFRTVRRSHSLSHR